MWYKTPFYQPLYVCAKNGPLAELISEGVMRILGIETSCDETGVAIYDSEQGLLADALYSQVDLHAEYGGVVPELASRDHAHRLLPLIKEVMAESDTSCTISSSLRAAGIKD